MNTINFDTLKAAKSLQDAGFETRQAEAVVGMVTYALSEGLATKEDVRDLKFSVAADMRELQSSLQSSIDALDVRIDALDVKIDNSVKALDARIDALDSKIDRSVAALEVKIDNGLKNVIHRLDYPAGRLEPCFSGAAGALSAVSVPIIKGRFPGAGLSARWRGCQSGRGGDGRQGAARFERRHGARATTCGINGAGRQDG